MKNHISSIGIQPVAPHLDILKILTPRIIQSKSAKKLNTFNRFYHTLNLIDDLTMKHKNKKVAYNKCAK